MVNVLKNVYVLILLLGHYFHKIHSKPIFASRTYYVLNPNTDLTKMERERTFKKFSLMLNPCFLKIQRFLAAHRYRYQIFIRFLIFKKSKKNLLITLICSGVLSYEIIDFFRLKQKSKNYFSHLKEEKIVAEPEQGTDLLPLVSVFLENPWTTTTFSFDEKDERNWQGIKEIADKISDFRTLQTRKIQDEGWIRKILHLKKFNKLEVENKQHTELKTMIHLYRQKIAKNFDYFLRLKENQQLHVDVSKKEILFLKQIEKISQHFTFNSYKKFLNFLDKEFVYFKKNCPEFLEDICDDLCLMAISITYLEQSDVECVEQGQKKLKNKNFDHHHTEKLFDDFLNQCRQISRKFLDKEKIVECFFDENDLQILVPFFDDTELRDYFTEKVKTNDYDLCISNIAYSGQRVKMMDLYDQDMTTIKKALLRYSKLQKNINDIFLEEEECFKKSLERIFTQENFFSKENIILIFRAEISPFKSLVHQKIDGHKKEIFQEIEKIINMPRISFPNEIKIKQVISPFFSKKMTEFKYSVIELFCKRTVVLKKRIRDALIDQSAWTQSQINQALLTYAFTIKEEFLAVLSLEKQIESELLLNKKKREIIFEQRKNIDGHAAFVPKVFKRRHTINVCLKYDALFEIESHLNQWKNILDDLAKECSCDLVNDSLIIKTKKWLPVLILSFLKKAYNNLLQENIYELIKECPHFYNKISIDKMNDELKYGFIDEFYQESLQKKEILEQEFVKKLFNVSLEVLQEIKYMSSSKKNAPVFSQQPWQDVVQIHNEWRAVCSDAVQALMLQKAKFFRLN